MTPNTDTEPNKLKVLYFDIETAPINVLIWHVFGDYAGQDQILHDSFLLTWAAKWDGESKVLSDRLTKQEVLAKDDARIVESLARLLREADVVVAHNGDKFDIPIVNKRLMLNELDPLPPFNTIDTLKLAKRNFRMEMNKLDFIAERLGLGRKIKTEFMLWRDAYEGNVAALKEMERYNKQDVVLLEQVLDRMKPYVRRLTRLFDGPGFSCPWCGSMKLQRRGKHRSQVTTWQRWHCMECKKYSRSKVILEKRHPLHPL